MAKEVGCVIGREITVRGEIEGREDLLVVGVVEGTIRLQAELIVGEGGAVKGEVATEALTVEGRFDGTAECADVVALRAGSSSTGSLTAPRIVIDEDALFTGILVMDVGLEATDGEAAHD